MLTPLYIQLKYWFYPTGNTPAVDILRDLPAPATGKEDTVRSLLLGCGDPRNILFSLWNEQGRGMSGQLISDALDLACYMLLHGSKLKVTDILRLLMQI